MFCFLLDKYRYLSQKVRYSKCNIDSTIELHKLIEEKKCRMSDSHKDMSSYFRRTYKITQTLLQVFVLLFLSYI